MIEQGKNEVLVRRPDYDRLLDTNNKLLQRAHLTCKRRRWSLAGVTFEFRRPEIADELRAAIAGGA